MTSENILDQPSDRSRPVGRILRFLLGAALVGLLSRSLINESMDIVSWSAVVVVGLIAFYTVVHFLVMKFTPNINRYLGTILALSPAAAVYMLLGTPGQIGVIGYIGGSLIVDAITADLGCEVMALPGLFFQKRTHLCCIVFSPIDWIENKLLSR
ncbi:MAG: hypothetical protein O7G86_01675 [Gammaproteobacteria bacterium]|nr:hypothetical protein [Gammaproteobacteria bacterium]